MDDFFGIIRSENDALAREWLMADEKNLLLAELYIAEEQARKGGKRKTRDTHAFEVNLYENLLRLRDALWSEEYTPLSGTAHVIFDPVQREIFAAPYWDRVTQHWVVNNIDRWWDKRFKGKRYKVLKHAIKEIILDDQIKGVRIEGSYEDWRYLPEDKSLFCQPEGQGMVIGNLTSQDFSNIYLDMLDRFITLRLGWKHYGRYVDDFYFVITEDELPQARRDIRAIDAFLNGIGLNLNKRKTRIILVDDGVPFLGMVVKNGAIIPGKRIRNNFTNSAYKLVGDDGSIESVVSYLGMLVHSNSKKMVANVFERVGWEYNW